MMQTSNLEINTIHELYQEHLKEMEDSSLLSRIPKFHLCEACGGTKVDLETGKCASCGYINEVSKEEVQKLNEILLRFKDVRFKLNEKNSHNLLELYLISQYNHLASLSEFIEKNKIEEQLRDKINHKIELGIALSPTEDKILYSLACIGVEKLKYFYIHGIFKDIFLKKQIVSQKTFQEVLKCFVVEEMKEINAGRIEKIFLTCSISSIKGTTEGSATQKEVSGIMFEEIVLSSEEIGKIYNGKCLNFVTVFHELFHIKDNLDIKTGVFTEELMPRIKDKVIRELSLINEKNTFGYNFDFYYKDNYSRINSEIDAEINGMVYFIRYLKNLGLDFDKKDEENLDKEIEDFLKAKTPFRNSINLPYVNSRTIKVNELLDLLIENSKETLENYPQLKIEYVIEDGKVRPKDIDELAITKNSLSKTDPYYQEKYSYLETLMERKKQEEGIKKAKK